MSSEWVELICELCAQASVSYLCPAHCTTIAAAALIRAVHCCKCTRSAQCPPPHCSFACCSCSSGRGGAYLPAGSSRAFAAAVQEVGRGQLACQGFPPRPHWSGWPVRLLVLAVTSALLCSAKISAHPVCRMQGPTGLNLSSDISCQNICIN